VLGTEPPSRGAVDALGNSKGSCAPFRTSAQNRLRRQSRRGRRVKGTSPGGSGGCARCWSIDPRGSPPPTTDALTSCNPQPGRPLTSHGTHGRRVAVGISERWRGLAASPLKLTIVTGRAWNSSPSVEDFGEPSIWLARETPLSLRSLAQGRGQSGRVRAGHPDRRGSEVPTPARTWLCSGGVPCRRNTD
jgi:hypothetical protein